MREKQRFDRLEQFRIFAAALVVAIHTSPLMSLSADADFFLTRVLGRIAVPFFFMVTGQFVVSAFPECGMARVLNYVKKIALLYGAAVILYIPIGIYAGQYKNLGISDVLRMLIFDGTFYHLWYFPACIIGILIVYAASCVMRRNKMMILAAVLYAAGLFGDSYYGLVEELPVVGDFYEAAFQLFSYTRNGIFLAPVFLLLGEAASSGTKNKKRAADARILWAGLAVSFVAMTEEAFLLRHFELQRHDSMYILLVPVMYFLYKILIQNAGRGTVRKKRPGGVQRYLGTTATWTYILHPAMIVVVRGAAKVTKLDLLVENSLVHYFVVCIFSFASAFMIAVFLDQWKGPVGGRKRQLLLQQKKSRRSRAQERQESKEQERQESRAQERQESRAQDFCLGRAWLEIDHEALQHNVAVLRSKLPADCRLMPAVKADAYGHGAVLIAGQLQKMGVDSFCVACVQEGIQLRRQGIRGEILILGYTHKDQCALLHQYHLTQTVIDYEYALQLNSCGVDIHVHIGIDTGMHRLGERSENIKKIMAVYGLEHLIVDGLYTHLSASDTLQMYGRAYTSLQAEAFCRTVAALREQGYPCPKLHMLASYGVLNYPELAGDYARVGIALYGVLSTKEDTVRWQEELQPVLSLKARIAAVKVLYQGESAGYGPAFTAARDMKIAVLAIGYADGLPRALSGGVGSVLIHGQRAPVIGRICMDQTIVDVTGIGDVKTGDTAVLIGRSGSMEISVCDIAAQAGTITNEILSRMGARLERVMV